MPATGLFSRPGLLTSAFFAALLLPSGAYQPFWPVWLAGRGLTAPEIASYLAAAGVVRIAAGFLIPVLADRAGARRQTLALLLAGAALVVLAHLAAEGRATLFLLTLLLAFLWSGAFPLADALGNAAAQSFGFSFARSRSFGSAAFLLGTLGAGALVAVLGTGGLPWWIALALLAAAPVAFLHPGGGRVRPGQVPRREDFRRLGADRTFLLFALAVGTAQGSHAVYYSLGPVHWQHLGLDAGEIGLSWGVAVAAETALLLLAGPWIDRRLGPVATLVIAAGAGIVRWLAMCLDPVGVWLWPLQALHAITFALGYLGMTLFIRMAVPAGLWATAQGFVSQLAAGAVIAFGMAAGGLVYPALGGGAYAVGAVLSAIGLVLALRLGRVWNRGLVGT